MSDITFYVLHGTDEYSRKAQIHALQGSMNDPSQLNTSIIQGSETSAQAVLNAVSAIPFLGDKRLVIVEDLLTQLSRTGKANQAELEILVDGLPKLPDFARLVFHESKDVSDKNPVLKLARNHERGFEKNFGVPQNLNKWIVSHAQKEYGITIQARAAAALESVIHQDLRIADGELAKLAAFVGYEREITEDDVAAMTAYVAEANIFEMVDAIGQGNGKQAIQLTQRLLEEGNDPLSLFGMIIRQFRLLLLTREYIMETGSTHGLDKAIGVARFIADKKLPAQVRHFDMEHLEAIYHKLADLDYEIKTGKIEAELALQLFITGVTN